MDKDIGDFDIRMVTLEQLGLFPINDLRNGSEDETYRIFKGQAYIVLPKIDSRYKLMSFSEVIQERVKISGESYFFNSPRSQIMDDNLACCDGIIGNYDRREVKISRKVFNHIVVDENTPHVSWTDPSLNKMTGEKTPLELKALEIHNPSGYIKVSDKGYDDLEGYIVSYDQLNKFGEIQNEGLKEELINYLLEGNLLLFYEYCKKQGMPGIDYSKIPICLPRNNGLNLLNIGPFKGKRSNEIGPESFVYQGTVFPTKVIKPI